MNQTLKPLLLSFERPENIKAAEGINQGEVVTSVNVVKGAKAYMHEYMPEPVTEEGMWLATNCTSRTCTIKGFQKEVSYVFRIGAVGPLWPVSL